MKTMFFIFSFFLFILLSGSEIKEFGSVGTLNIQEFFINQKLLGNIKFYFFTDSETKIHSLELNLKKKDKVLYVWKNQEKPEIIVNHFPVDLFTLRILSQTSLPIKHSELEPFILELNNCFSEMDAFCEISVSDTSIFFIKYFDVKNDISFMKTNEKYLDAVPPENWTA